MKLKYWMAGTAVAICVGLASPALGDNVNTNTNNNSNTNNTNTQNNSTSSSSATANSNGLTYDLDLNYDASTNYSVSSTYNVSYDASTDYVVTYDSFNDTYTETNEATSSDHGSVSASQSGQVDTVASGEDSNAASRGGQIDTVASGEGSQAASRGGEISNDSHNTEGGSISASQGGENEIYGDGSASRGGIAGSTVDSNFDSVVADQELRGTIVGHDMYAMVDNVNQYNSGDNSVRGNAFAAYSGILNQAWNTGLVANTQAGTNIAASAEINFATNSGAECPGNSCH